MNSAARQIVIAEWVAPQPGERILELGCGAGLLARELAARGAQVTAIDTAALLIEQARLLNPSIEFVCADLRYYRAEEPFDAVVAAGVLQWAGPLEPLLERIRDFLKTGGRLAVTLGGAGHPPPDPARLHSELARLLFSDIEVDRVEGQLWIWARRGGA